MRIVAGQWKGRRLSAPRGHDTRPTADRVREALFSTVYTLIGPLDGLAVADLYAGSGALGLEAMSRGASRCTFVEQDRVAAELIRSNTVAVGADPASVTVLRMRVEQFVRGPGARTPVSLLLVDPPYRIDAVEFSQVLEALATAGFFEAGALVAYEHSSSIEPAWPSAFHPKQSRRYGDTAVSFATYEG